MAGIVVIADRTTSLGFRLAGVECIDVEGDGDITGLLLELVSGDRYGLIVVDERLFNRVPEKVMRRIKKKGYPVVVPITIPRRWVEKEAVESPMARLIKRAIGYQIRIKK